MGRGITEENIVEKYFTAKQLKTLSKGQKTAVIRTSGEFQTLEFINREDVRTSFEIRHDYKLTDQPTVRVISFIDSHDAYWQSLLKFIKTGDLIYFRETDGYTPMNANQYKTIVISAYILRDIHLLRFVVDIENDHIK
jgi:hypothetical protein